jgi:hypothetical protein
VIISRAAIAVVLLALLNLPFWYTATGDRMTAAARMHPAPWGEVPVSQPVPCRRRSPSAPGPAHGRTRPGWLDPVRVGGRQ